MNYKLRIKHPSGAEFEAEGPAEFILSEKESFLSRLTPGEEPAIAAGGAPEADQNPAWEGLTETKNGLTTLKFKHPGVKAGEAALYLLAAETRLKGTREISAINLSKAVKASGFAPERLDRVIAKAIRERLIKASGTKRNTTYQITDKGLEIAWLEARKLK
ncbi:MAG: hypothetical protein COX65_02000 [Elusimicrobia bacterium CG_4_10_14_0_2_um_filter_56_8]|nr:MAG: hypothetical protein AUJ51_03990 [Elusimicrobia bacterium CG1_02_56_21]PJA16675.1 MAG: hypothetical protein COX65_02000 [Elusimicrobia bacterium CG_4_10_14_0_2_um_filter_56_8]